MDPKETSSYFGLANIYEQSGDYDRAEQMLNKAREMRPNDSAVYMQLAGYYNRQGDFTKTMEALHERTKQEPTNPEAHYTVATYYWEKAYRDFTTPEADKMKFVQQGLQAIDEAIRLNPKYFEALDLQEPAAPRSGQPGEGPGAAAGAAPRGQRVARQGAGNSKEGAGRRRRIAARQPAPSHFGAAFRDGRRPFFLVQSSGLGSRPRPPAPVTASSPASGRIAKNQFRRGEANEVLDAERGSAASPDGSFVAGGRCCQRRSRPPLRRASPPVRWRAWSWTPTRRQCGMHR